MKILLFVVIILAVFMIADQKSSAPFYGNVVSKNFTPPSGPSALEVQLMPSMRWMLKDAEYSVKVNYNHITKEFIISNKLWNKLQIQDQVKLRSISGRWTGINCGWVIDGQ